MKQLIRDFLTKYCTRVQYNESSDYVELIMDNHCCVLFEDEEWYVPNDNSFWDEDENLLQEFIVNNYEL